MKPSRPCSSRAWPPDARARLFRGALCGTHAASADFGGSRCSALKQKGHPEMTLFNFVGGRALMQVQAHEASAGGVLRDPQCSCRPLTALTADSPHRQPGAFQPGAFRWMPPFFVPFRLSFFSFPSRAVVFRTGNSVSIHGSFQIAEPRRYLIRTTSSGPDQVMVSGWQPQGAPQPGGQAAQKLARILVRCCEQAVLSGLRQGPQDW